MCDRADESVGMRMRGCVDVRMRCVCVQTRMSGEKKRKKDNLLMGWGWPRWRVDADALRVDADE